MTTINFTPHHMNANIDDFAGNQGIGRYILLPGSDGRAREMSEHFHNVKVKMHPRGHHLYLGTIKDNDISIDVATISTGMGCPSIEIILHELFHLGAKRFLRVGTAGSLQPNYIQLGDIIHVLGSVRDEQTTSDYVPIEVPAIASHEFTYPIIHAAKKLKLSAKLHSGLVHCKSSFYAREFGAGPMATENKKYIDLLTPCGVLATEMETAALFIQSQLYHHQLKQLGHHAEHRVLAGAILGILAVPPHQFATQEESLSITHDLIHMGLETLKNLARSERTDAIPDRIAPHAADSFSMNTNFT